mmetsp:Transcript_38725/g.92506  ORF Transcript_38725/g.92506 Transcript_38725/m.92506 type:complete len:339 (-) Transcript_38725:956-1972(-)
MPEPPPQDLPTEHKLAGIPGHPVEVSLHELAVPSEELGNQRGQQREEGSDSHAGSDSHKHLLVHSRLRWGRVGAVQGHPRHLLSTSGCIEAPLCQLLRPVPDAGDDEIHRGIVLAGGDGERMPLQLCIVRHADEGVHARMKPPKIRRGADLQLREGSYHAPVLCRTSGGAQDLHGLSHEEVVAQEPCNAAKGICEDRERYHNHHQGYADAYPALGAMEKEEDGPRNDRHVVQVPEHLEASSTETVPACPPHHTEYQYQEEASQPRKREKECLGEVHRLLFVGHGTFRPMEDTKVHVEDVGWLLLRAAQQGVQLCSTLLKDPRNRSDAVAHRMQSRIED